MRICKRLSVIILSLALFLVTLTGCFGEDMPIQEEVNINDIEVNPEELTGNLKIALYLGGFGTDFLTTMIERFKEIYPNVTIDEPEYFITDTPAIEMIKAGPQDNDIDLFIAGPVYAGDLVEQGNSIIKDYDPILEDLSDVYASKPYNEEKTIEEKTYKSVANSLRYNPDIKRFPDYEKYSGNIYSLPWAYGPGGLIFNKTFFDANPSYKTPNTTDELTALVNKIYADYVTGKSDSQKVYPVIWAGDNAASYWRYVTAAWIAQYDGLASWDNFLKTVDDAGNYSNEVFNTAGMLKALEALAPIIDSNKCYPNSVGTKHVDAQVQLMRGKAAMLPSGDWTENETLNSDSFGSKGPDEIIMIKTPVISALGEKLGITDEQLSNIVTAIDNGETSFPGISDEIFSRVKEARSIAVNCDFNHNIVIPAYSEQKLLAKTFIRFMFSDEGLKIFFEKANGFMPYQYTLSESQLANASAFTKSTYEIGRTSTVIAMDYSKSPIMYRNNLQLYNLPDGLIEVQLGNKNPITPQEAMDKAYEYIKNRWNTYKRIAGIK